MEISEAPILEILSTFCRQKIHFVKVFSSIKIRRSRLGRFGIPNRWILMRTAFHFRDIWQMPEKNIPRKYKMGVFWIPCAHKVCVDLEAKPCLSRCCDAIQEVVKQHAPFRRPTLEYILKIGLVWTSDWIAWQGRAKNSLKKIEKWNYYCDSRFFDFSWTTTKSHDKDGRKMRSKKLKNGTSIVIRGFWFQLNYH